MRPSFLEKTDVRIPTIWLMYKTIVLYVTRLQCPLEHSIRANRYNSRSKLLEMFVHIICWC